MEPEKKDEAPESQQPDAQAPADALSKTPDELDEDEAARVAAGGTPAAADEPVKKLPFFKRLFRKVNVYFLIFILLVVVAGVITVVNYLNSQKAPVEPNIASQTLDQNSLSQLANSDVNVGSTSQTLTIQGNAIIAGQTLARGNLSVAGNFQVGGSITAPSLTISGTSNLGTTQINSLQVATTTSIQGTTTLHDLNVAGASSFSGPMTASQITVTHLILSGNASLEVPNHIAFTGASPNRTINSTTLGSGGTASINGSDVTGTLNINTGNNTSAGCFAQITFNQAFSSQPHILVTPVGIGASQTAYYVTRNNSSFSICTSNAAPANQSFSFDYFVTGS